LKKFNDKREDQKRRREYWLDKFINFEIKDNFINDKREYYRTEYLHSEPWKQLRMQKICSVNKCENCGSSLCLDVHHLNYKNLYDVELSDLQVLCRGCHIKEHDKEETLKKSKYVRIEEETRQEYLPTRGESVGNMEWIGGKECPVINKEWSSVKKERKAQIKKLKKLKKLEKPKKDKKLKSSTEKEHFKKGQIFKKLK
jgi:hypothetical protein